MAEEETSNNQTRNNPTTASTDPNNPYYLHPGDSPGFVLISPPLSGEKNYYHRSHAMRRALSSKNKIKFINGELPKPAADDPFFDCRERCNNIVVPWITRTLNAQISQSIIGIDSARDLWLDLEDWFSKGNNFRMPDVLQELHSMRQGDRSLSTFFTEMKILWDEFEYLCPTPNCSCHVPCSCALSKFVKNFKETESHMFS